MQSRTREIKKYPTFFSDEDITGKIEITRPSSNFDYTAITVELIGFIENYIEPKNSIKFLSLNNDISKNGNLSKEKTVFNFSFKKVKLQYESYKGDLICLQYFIKVNIIKSLRSFSYEEEFAVIKPNNMEILKIKDEPISMHVGIKNLLSIVIELNHINYSIHGTLKGSVTFGKVNLLITKMEIQLIKKETIYGNSSNNKNNVKTKIIATYELIDGGPYKNETIPFRFFLEPYKLTPTYKDISIYFSTRYFLNLVIKDQDNNRYFKQKEIFLFRLFLNNKNKYKNNIEHLKDFITEPIDFGDYFSSFNEVDNNKEEKEKEKDDIIKEPEESEFYFKSNLKGFLDNNNDEEDESNNNEIINDFDRNNFINVKNRSNSVFDINRNILNNLNINDSEDDIEVKNNNNNYKDEDYLIENKKKNISTTKTEKSNKKNKIKENKNQVINIKEKNKYKNNDILINDNYYNVDDYIIYENSYNNVFDNKLKTTRIKKNISNDNKKQDDNNQNIIIDNNLNINNNDISDFKLYFPNEPFSNSLILNNLPSNYSSIGDGDNNNDFRKNLMGERIKNNKK